MWNEATIHGHYDYYNTNYNNDSGNYNTYTNYYNNSM